MNQIDRFIKQAEELFQKMQRANNIVKAAVLVAIVLCVIFMKSMFTKEMVEASMQQKIAEEIIRFHVLANSDSKEDQQVKLKVKDEIVSYMQGKLTGVTSKEEAKEVLAREDETIRQIATKVLRDNGYSYPVASEFAKVQFPVKQYGDLSFPAGEYDAYRVLIGQAKGKNWWCVMFPSLCAVNETYSVVPDESKDTLKNVLTEEEYASIDTKYHFWLTDALSNIF